MRGYNRYNQNTQNTQKVNTQQIKNVQIPPTPNPSPETTFLLDKPANIIPENPIESDKTNNIINETKKEDINIDEYMEKKLTNKKRIINLDDKKKKKPEKKEYDLDDVVIREITLTGNIHARLISNANGYFVDLRRYMRTFPTKKGIRILATKFMQACEFLRKDYEELVPKSSEINNVTDNK